MKTKVVVDFVFQVDLIVRQHLGKSGYLLKGFVCVCFLA
jgi:hypothetical protein